MRRAALVVALLAAALGGSRPAAQGDELALILSGLAERTQQYYDRFISIICTETVHQQDLRFNLAPTGRPRTTVFELSVSRDPRAEGRERVPHRSDTAIGRWASRAEESAAGMHRSEDGVARAARISACRQSESLSLRHSRRGCGRPGGHTCTRLHRNPSRARARQLGRNCFEARRWRR